MSSPPIDLAQPFYRTFPLPCPYLEKRMERRIFTMLDGPNARMIFDILTRAGFRRSLNTVYQPTCQACEACVAVRILVDGFAPNRSMKRVLRKNRDLKASFLPARATPEQYRLFARYLASRHSEGEMAHMTWEEYLTLAEDTPVETLIAEFRDDRNTLVAACITDRLGDALSAVYSFFDPRLARRGLGNYMILWLVEKARVLGLPHVYLGYWIGECPKMSYKARFQPMERLNIGGWESFAG